MPSHVLTFGPFIGQTVAEVAAVGRIDYLRWLRDQRNQERTPAERDAFDAELAEVAGD